MRCYKQQSPQWGESWLVIATSSDRDFVAAKKKKLCGSYYGLRFILYLRVGNPEVLGLHMVKSKPLKREWEMRKTSEVSEGGDPTHHWLQFLPNMGL